MGHKMMKATERASCCKALCMIPFAKFVRTKLINSLILASLYDKKSLFTLLERAHFVWCCAESIPQAAAMSSPREARIVVGTPAPLR